MVATCSFFFSQPFSVSNTTQVKNLTLFLINSIQTALFRFLFRGGIIHDAFAFRFSRSWMASFPSYCCLCPVPSPAGFCLYCFSAVVPHTAGRTLAVQHCDPLCARWICWSSAPQCLQSCYWLIEVNTRCFFFFIIIIFWFGIVPVILMSRCSQVTLAKATSSLCVLGFFFFPTFCFCLYINSENMQMHRQSWTRAAGWPICCTESGIWDQIHLHGKICSLSSLIWHLKHEELRISREAFKTLHI